MTYNLPILLSGSTANTQDRTIHVALDKDTLNTLNEERYGQRDKLYYQLLESQYYTTPESVEIPAGESIGVLPIDLTLGLSLIHIYAYEGVNIYKKNGFYYLLASIGSCCAGENSTYELVVGRSQNILGPYVDRKNVDVYKRQTGISVLTIITSTTRV